MARNPQPVSVGFDTPGQAKTLWDGHQSADFRLKGKQWQNVRPGWKLWVREPWTVARQSGAGHEPVALWDKSMTIQRVGSSHRIIEISSETRANGWPIKTTAPAKTMPRWASRMDLHVTEVKWRPCQEIAGQWAVDAAMVSQMELGQCRNRDEREELIRAMVKDSVATRYGYTAWLENREMVLYRFMVARVEQTPPGTVVEVSQMLPVLERIALVDGKGVESAHGR